MRISFRFLPVIMLMTGAISSGVAHAADPPSLVGAPLPDPNGFDTLLEAIKRFEGSMGAGAGLGPLDLLRFQRNNVTRSGVTLKKIEEALQLPIQHPQVRNLDDDYGNYKGFRSLAILLKQQSAVRASDGDWIGSVNSDLDCIQMGIAITRGGPLRAALAGQDIENMGRKDIENVARRLSVDECRAVSARLMKIEALRPPYVDALAEEKNTALALTKQSFEERDWNDVIAETKKSNGQPFTDEEKTELGNAGESEILANIAQVLDQVQQGAEAPYRYIKPGSYRPADPWTRLITDTVVSTSYRVNYENARAQNRMLQVAFELTAQKLLSGKYPATVDLPIDPFASDTNLKYKLDGDGYLLYSNGPNGKDDGGTPAIFPSADGKIAPDAKGDLVAPVFPQ